MSLEKTLVKDLKPVVLREVKEYLDDFDNAHYLLGDSVLKVTNDYLENNNERVVEKLGNMGINKVVEEFRNNNEVREQVINNIQDKVEQYLIEKINKTVIPIKTVNVVVGNKTYSSTGAYHRDFEKLLKVSAQKIPLFLKGPAGSGKNYTVLQIAEVLKLKLYRCNSPSDKFELDGYNDVNGKYVETAFYKAFTTGGMFLLDEIDNSCPAALIAINDAISNGIYQFPNGTWKMHDTFRVIATANTWGNGRSFEYIGRNKIDLATIDRFYCIEYGYDKDLENLLCPDNEILNVFWELREQTMEHKIRAIFSLRGIKYSYILKQSGMNLEDIAEGIIMKGLGVDDLKKLTKNLRNDIFSNNNFAQAVMNVYDRMHS